jgi:hypothetical protein
LRNVLNLVVSVKAQEFQFSKIGCALAVSTPDTTVAAGPKQSV